MQRAVLAAFLQAQGHYVDTSEDGLDALRKGRLGWFHVVIMDYGLPEIDGLAAARLIGDCVGGDRRPILIALSATIDALMGNAAGPEIVFDALVQKPWQPDALLETIADCCRRRGADPRQAAPAAENPMLQPGAQDGPTAPDAVRILVVDDDDLFRSVVVAALGSQGFRIDTAAQGLEALRMIGRSHYDVAILDYHLPEIDGLAIARLTHELVPGPQRPRLIGLTSSPQDLNHREAGSVSAFDEVILKSSDLHDLISTVHLCIAYRQARSTSAGVNILDLATVMAPQ